MFKFQLEEHCNIISQLMNVGALFSKDGRRKHRPNQHTQTECAKCYSRLTQTTSNSDGSVLEPGDRQISVGGARRHSQPDSLQDEGQDAGDVSGKDVDDDDDDDSEPAFVHDILKSKTKSSMLEREFQAPPTKRSRRSCKNGGGESNDSQVMYIKEEQPDDPEYSDCQYPSASDSYTHQTGLNQYDPAMESTHSDIHNSWAGEDGLSHILKDTDNDDYRNDDTAEFNTRPGGSSVDNEGAWGGPDTSMQQHQTSPKQKLKTASNRRQVCNSFSGYFQYQVMVFFSMMQILLS